jgi:hypothetical protein
LVVFFLMHGDFLVKVRVSGSSEGCCCFCCW